MPNIQAQQTIVQYITNSSQTQYTFAFYAPLPTDIQVFYQASNATPIPASDILVLNTQYTVTYNSDPTTGGYITLLFSPTSGYYLTINRQVAPSLNTNFSNAQNFNGINLDAALDRLLLLIQQNFNYITQRNLSYVINTYLPNATPYTQLPPLPQNYFWVGSGSGVIAAQIAQVPSASVLQSMLANNSPGTDGATIVGYYNNLTSTSTTVDATLTSLVTNVNTIEGEITTIQGQITTLQTFYGSSIYVTGNIVVGNGVNLLLFNTVYEDPQSLFSVSKGGFVIQKAGYYRINSIVLATISSQTNDVGSILLYKNGVNYKVLGGSPQNGGTIEMSGNVIDHANVNDYYQIYCENNNAASITVVGNQASTTFDIQFLGT